MTYAPSATLPHASNSPDIAPSNAAQPLSKKSTNQQPNPLSLQDKTALVEVALTDVKAKDVTTLNVEQIADAFDRVVIASGTSSRHLKALADSVLENAKAAGLSVLGIEGEADAEWILVDLASIVVHIMLPKTRAFYDLESLWRDPAQELPALAS